MIAQPRMELPCFDGTNARSWLLRAEQYFLVHETPEFQRVKMAMVGTAMSWFQLLQRRIPGVSWSTLKEELLLRFGEASVVNIYESLAQVKHTSSLEEYIAAFEDHVAQIPNFSDIHYKGFFLSGLRRELRVQIPDVAMKDYSAKVQMVRKIDGASQECYGNATALANPGSYVSRLGSSARTTHPPNVKQQFTTSERSAGARKVRLPVVDHFTA